MSPPANIGNLSLYCITRLPRRKAFLGVLEACTGPVRRHTPPVQPWRVISAPSTSARRRPRRFCAVQAFSPQAEALAQGGFNAQPLAALPPYGCGAPLAGASAQACKIKGWRPPPAARTQKERHDLRRVFLFVFKLQSGYLRDANVGLLLGDAFVPYECFAMGYTSAQAEFISVEFVHSLYKVLSRKKSSFFLIV